MGCRAYVHTKHEIEYGDSHFNWAVDAVGDWLAENGVDVCEFNAGDYSCQWEWEIDKEQLRARSCRPSPSRRM